MPTKIKFKINDQVMGTCREVSHIPLMKGSTYDKLKFTSDGIYDLQTKDIPPTDLVHFFGVEHIPESSAIIPQFMIEIEKQMINTGYDPALGLYILEMNSIDALGLHNFPDILNPKYNFDGKAYLKYHEKKKLNDTKALPIFGATLVCDTDYNEAILLLMSNSNSVFFIKDILYLNTEDDSVILQVQQIMDRHKAGLFENMITNNI